MTKFPGRRVPHQRKVQQATATTTIESFRGVLREDYQQISPVLSIVIYHSWPIVTTFQSKLRLIRVPRGAWQPVKLQPWRQAATQVRYPAPCNERSITTKRPGTKTKAPCMAAIHMRRIRSGFLPCRCPNHPRRRAARTQCAGSVGHRGDLGMCSGRKCWRVLTPMF